MSITVRIPGRPPTPNDYRGRNGGGHWAKRGKEAADWKQRAWTEATLAKPHGWEPLTRATMTVEFVVPDKRRRDLDNLVSSTKHLTDGIVLAGILVDDNTDVLVQVTYRVRYERGVSATEYVIAAAGESAA